ncbi:intradiol ring-cleavage dioxygenase [Gulosibacter sp. ACHW.36C]|uniref:Intradiol ring-cleavage dioxygenase n=1 Tax=Gulosibacter sediminis TaxID=1729695 RepID=A0ABY4MW43_9MICO|nr:intradiol ring-cleavage dioxygenase [Gulosibacter sediminis]UQN13930.1 intradiol ring-cleavage dioxygenase [Gulosibacter sediminis]
MTGFPDPDETPEGPKYQGRKLDRPDEEVVDQGASFDITTLLTRRGVLGVLGVGAVGTFLAACTAGATGTTATQSATSSASASASATASASASATATEALPAGEIPDETAGPYPGDGSNGPDVLEESGIVRSDIRSSIGADDPVDGVPLDFTLRITDMANGDRAFEGVAVYAWHCNALGEYSLYSSGVEDESWLRGVQVADANGQVTFKSIVPGCYSGRWPHIHFEVYPDVSQISDSTNAIATSQMALPQSMVDPVYESSTYTGSANNLAQITLDSDNVFGEDGGALQLATVAGNETDGYTASLVVRVDTTTQPTAGGGGGGGGRP